ncbi:Uncharacterised protein [Mycobacterium tuberculosis]|nr:Uncharacterised protein [Mycobacterium tuberculosis]SGD25644.1 Uncharacterised protein [Mycobacterium tuberculosis]SGK35136.1 Uncharacterised protein [Mycobacterium tuberculosis]SGN02355.1 Uncharacterised protein [Mycobacterium tuberculosis]SGO04649.1 Uncharacterised protein [Mycobacterium tuberculosis]
MQQAVDVVEDVVFGDLVADRVAVELEDDAGDVVDAAVAVVVYFGVGGGLEIEFAVTLNRPGESGDSLI